MKIENLKKSFWNRQIFNEAEMSMDKSEKAWLVWVNGVWKTTLFKLLSWEDKDYEWKIIFDEKDPLIWYMKQNLDLENNNLTILEFLKKDVWITEIEDKVNELAMQMWDYPDKINEYSDAYTRFEKLWWYEFDYRVEKLLSQMWLSKFNTGTKISSLSWWEKRKVLLVSTILKWWDLILLDEPTNDLDRESIIWLTEALKESLAACLIISHDKEFLNNVVTNIYEIEWWNINSYTWNYDFYEQQKLNNYSREKELYERQQEEEKRIKQQTAELRQKAHQIWKSGNTRDNDKWDWAAKVEKKLAQRAKALEWRLERIEKIKKPTAHKPLQINLYGYSEPAWNIQIDSQTFNYWEEFTLKIPNITIWKQDKVLIQWDNWTGKSTFIKLLLWDLESKTWSIHINPLLSIGYFSQEWIKIPKILSPVEYFNNELWYWLTDVHFALWSMWFSDNDKRQKIGLLSPWMALRLKFVEMVLKKNNCLILDEPTNHIDVEIKEALKQAITNFNGIVILVSHDKNFVDSLKFTKKLQFWKWTITEL